MNTLGKIIALLSGAIAGAVLAEWLDRQLISQAQKKSEYDRTRYAQGLAPRAPTPSSIEERTFENRSFDRPYYKEE